jgi:hypothetical protein
MLSLLDRLHPLPLSPAHTHNYTHRNKHSSVKMFGESTITDSLHPSQCLNFNALKRQIVDTLPHVYPRHTSSNILKGFSLRFTIDGESGYFTATAVAELTPPTSIMDGIDVVLDDNFLGTYSEDGFWDALEQMREYVEGLAEEGNPGTFCNVCMIWGVVADFDRYLGKD